MEDATITIERQGQQIAITGIPNPLILARENLDSFMMSIDDFVYEHSMKRKGKIEIINGSVLYE